MNVSPDVIYIIRHAEKPLKPPLSGVDFQGSHDEHSLLPRGWQRSGALAVLFHPDRGPERAGLRTPTVLVAPSWGHPGKTAAHRSYQTIQGLSESLELPITSPFAQGQERELADSVVRGHSGVVLICWEHDHIPVIASSLPVVSGSAIPQKWPGSRYDVIWSFTLVPEPGPARYTFGQIPQRLLSGDAATVIPAGRDDPAGRLRSRCRFVTGQLFMTELSYPPLRQHAQGWSSGMPGPAATVPARSAPPHGPRLERGRAPSAASCGHGT